MIFIGFDTLYFYFVYNCQAMENKMKKRELVLSSTMILVQNLNCCIVLLESERHSSLYVL